MRRLLKGMLLVSLLGLLGSLAVVSVGPMLDSIFSCGHLTTVVKGNMYSFFAIAGSGESQWMTVGRR